MAQRHFKNTFTDYDACSLMPIMGADGELEGDFGSNLDKTKSSLLEHWEAELSHDGVDWSDYSVYTGTSGYALLHMKLHRPVSGDNKHLRKAAHYIERSLPRLKGMKVSFLCGDAGPLAVGSVLYHVLNETTKSKDCLARLLSLQQLALAGPDVPDELLLGRTGYLYSLLFVQKHLGESAIDKDAIHKVFDSIIQSGQHLSRRERSPCPLLYTWHDKMYLGAAHGLAGIFYILMMVNDKHTASYLNDLVKPSLDYLMTLRFPSGNYPSSVGSSSGDKLVHWCHGAPGWLHLFIKAYKTFGDGRYLAEAVSCGEVVWSRGILRKGYGLCHGVAGNAYCFLAMYRLTNEKKYLFRACKFAEWCISYGEHGCPSPDRPWSLYEGLAGTVYFLLDIQKPSLSSMPAFEI